jgi:hypothetical protein
MGATSSDPLSRLEAVLRIGETPPSRRMLVIVNPYASTVSDRLKNLVVYALRVEENGKQNWREQVNRERHRS